MIPEVTVRRLYRIWRVLENLAKKEIAKVSSSQLEEISGYSSLSIRKDFGWLQGVNSSRQGYEVDNLKACIEDALELSKKKRVAVVGLNKLGVAMLDSGILEEKGFQVVAGFDYQLNRMESLQVTKQLFPAYDIEEMIEALNIEVGVLTAEADVAQKMTDRLVRGGVKTVINFSPVMVYSISDSCVVRHVDLLSEFVMAGFDSQQNALGEGE